MPAAFRLRLAVLIGIATLGVAMLVVFTVVVQQAETRGQQRRAYQQQTGHIMVGTESAPPVSLAPR